ncbi:hypothetical protein KEM48_008051, partial [Puccinia striiformis f. sp. tritici PST-130]
PHQQLYENQDRDKECAFGLGTGWHPGTGLSLRKNGTNTAPDTTWRVLAVLLAGTG